MSLFRHHAEPVTADVGTGFVATEAPALQTAIKSALHVRETKDVPVPAELTFSAGAVERVVVAWRNRYVGFVPATHLALMRGQLVAAGSAPLVADGEVYWDGQWWRVWVGPQREADDLPRVGISYDELAPQPPSIFGFPISRLQRRDQ